MTEDQAQNAVRDGRRIRHTWNSGVTRAEGRAVAYSIVPMLLVETDDGERVWWRHDMSELIPDTT